MKLFDSHCHLDDRAYAGDIETVIKRMNGAGIVKAMIVGTTLERSIKAVSIANSASGLYASVGIHPHAAKSCSEATLEILVKFAKNPKVRAWGEIGLDFNRMFSPRKDQEKWFSRQLEISDDLGLPVIFHERDSNGRLIEILKRHFKKGRNGVIHCFSGNKIELEQYLDLGLYIGITGIVTIQSRGADLRKLVPLIPTERICPFGLGQTGRGKGGGSRRYGQHYLGKYLQTVRHKLVRFAHNWNNGILGNNKNNLLFSLKKIQFYLDIKCLTAPSSPSIESSNMGKI